MSTMVMNPTVVALPRLRLTPRGRAVFGTLAAIPLVLLALALGVGAPSADAGAAASLDTFSYVSSRSPRGSRSGRSPRRSPPRPTRARSSPTSWR